MTLIIDLKAKRDERNAPDPDCMSRDHDGQPLYTLPSTIDVAARHSASMSRPSHTMRQKPISRRCGTR